MTEPAVFTTTELTKDYGGVGVFDVGLRIPRGSVYGLVGPNGAGKTTLLSLLAGLRRADRGSIGFPPSRAAICPDLPEFEPWLTATEVVALSASLGRRRSTGVAADALAQVGLTEAADRRVQGFSRGMLQRLGVAATLVREPDLMILDEPTSGLDPNGRSLMLDLVGGLAERATVIFSSHILTDVQRICDQVGILRTGRLCYQGTTTALLDRHTRPVWQVRLRGRADGVAAVLREQAWVTAVEAEAPGVLRVTATGVTEGEHGIPAVVAAQDAALTSLLPLEADLEAVFLSLVGDTSDTSDTSDTGDTGDVTAAGR